MSSLPITSTIFAAVLLTACSDPQTPASSGTAAPSSTPSTSATSTETTAPSASATATQAPAGALEPYVLTFLQTGGIAGLRMEVVLDTGAKKLSYGGLRNQQPQTKDVTPDEVAAITRALEEARFMEARVPAKPTTMSDAFSYQITVKTAGKEHSVAWTDGVEAPPAIVAVHSAITRLREAKFSTRPGAAGGAER